MGNVVCDKVWTEAKDAANHLAVPRTAPNNVSGSQVNSGEVVPHQQFLSPEQESAPERGWENDGVGQRGRWTRQRRKLLTSQVTDERLLYARPGSRF